MVVGESGQMHGRRSKIACIRCRHHRVKCNFATPKCANCQTMGTNCEILHPLSGKAIPRDYVEQLERYAYNMEKELSIIGRVGPVSSDESDFSLWGRSSGMRIGHDICSRLHAKLFPGDARLNYPSHRKHHVLQTGATSLPTLPPKYEVEEAIIGFYDIAYPYFPLMGYEELIGKHYITVWRTGPLAHLEVPEACVPTQTNHEHRPHAPNQTPSSSGSFRRCKTARLQCNVFSIGSYGHRARC